MFMLLFDPFVNVVGDCDNCGSVALDGCPLQIVDVAPFEKMESENEETHVRLQAYYKLLDCELIDIVHYEFAGIEFDVICDDEGLCADDVRSAVVFEDKGKPSMLVCNKILLCHNSGPNETGINCGDFEKVFSCIRFIKTDSGLNYPVLLCDYKLPDNVKIIEVE